MPVPSKAINPGPVFCAGRVASIRVAQTTLPSMRGTLAGWFKPMIIGLVSFAIATEGDNDGESVPTTREIRTSGMLQPGESEKLEIGAEGTRSWQGWVLHVYRQLDVPTDTFLQIDGRPYTVMARKDYVSNGYIRYELVEGYTAAQ